MEQDLVVLAKENEPNHSIVFDKKITHPHLSELTTAEPKTMMEKRTFVSDTIEKQEKTETKKRQDLWIANKAKADKEQLMKEHIKEQKVLAIAKEKQLALEKEAQLLKEKELEEQQKIQLAAQAEQQRQKELQAVQESFKQPVEQPVVKEEVVAVEEPSIEKEPVQPVVQEATPSDGQTLTVEATAYSTNQPSLGTTTATGINLNQNPRVIAVDPNVIPLGSTVSIEGYGTYTAGDTGSDIIGNRIDVHITSLSQAKSFGRKTLTLTILD